MDEIRLLSIEDEQHRLEESLEKLQDNNVVNTPMKGSDDTDDADSIEPASPKDEKVLEATVIRQGIKTDILRCRVKAKKLREKMSPH